MATKPSGSPPSRPFGQPQIAARSARLEPFEGLAFRFHILLPRYRQSREEVFSADDTELLVFLLTSDFGGGTISDVEKSPVTGFYEMRELKEQTLAVDVHTEFTVYTKPTQRCRDYFAQLELNLREHLWQTRGIREEQILIERIEVEIMRGKPKPRRRNPKSKI
jgi:hypothetical protein